MVDLIDTSGTAPSNLGLSISIAGSFNYDLNFIDGLTHQLPLYAADFDTSGRSQRIDIVDGTTGLVLDSRSMTAFSAGQYLVWNVSGYVIVRVVSRL